MTALVENELIGKHPNSSGWYRITCPFCEERTGKEDHRESMSVSLAGYYQCWKCEARGWIEPSTELEYEPVAKEQAKTVIKLPFDFELVGEEPGLSSFALEPARLFLQRRLGDRWLDLARVARIGASLSNMRVVIPIHGQHGELTGWVARDYTGRAAIKYMTAKGMKRALYNLGAIHNPPFALGVEGMFDALPFLPLAFPFLGKPSDEQLDLLVASAPTVPIVICLDGDARDFTWATVKRLQMRGIRAYPLLLRQGDPGNFAQDPQRLINRAQELISG